VIDAQLVLKPHDGFLEDGNVTLDSLPNDARLNVKVLMSNVRKSPFVPSHKGTASRSA
jgi:hypothetical protein